MSEPKLITPLLAEHIMGAPISDHHGVRCCPAMHKETEQKCMVKIISIPASQVQLDALILSGAYPTPEAANAYFRRLADDTVAEAELLQKLSDLEGFSAYEGWQLEPMEGGIGFDVYLLGPYGMTLDRHTQRNSMTQLAAVNLGLDLCTALSVARRNGYLYVDLKPENILITENRGYQICDLGFIRLHSLKYASLPEKYRSAYTAPEVNDAYASLNTTMDIYAAGLVLYQLFNGGQPPEPGAEILPPSYADYELAQILLKACAPDPTDRWQDPQEMGQALISYMQRNGVNDVPIIPIPSAPVEETAPAEEPIPAEEEILPDPEPQEELPPQEPIPAADPQDPEPEEEIGDLEDADDIPPILAPVMEETLENPEETEEPVEESDPAPEQFVIEGFDPDDTAPGDEDVDAYPDAPVSDEVSAMLAQADELIAHKAPDPVVAPEPIDVPIPDPIVEEPEPEELPPEEEAEPQPEPEPEPEPEPIPEPEDDPEPVPAKPKKKFGWIIALLVIVLLLAAVFTGGNYYYNHYYLQTIHDISLSGSQDRLTVTLDTEIDNSLLTVTCTDTYGNKLTQKVENNQATFTQLPSGTTYKISVVIDGKHQLIGDTSATYTTATQTTIVTFTAITGDSDGSVILNFSVQGPDTAQWLVKYVTEGEAPQTTACSGHMAIITGLTVGKTYTFRLISQDDLYITGSDTLKFTVSPVIYAQDLTIHGFDKGVLHADWKIPEGLTVDSWTVRCYNSTGVDLVFTTTEPAIAIEGLDISQGYTLDVKANGMTVSRWTSISPGSITFKDILLDNSIPGKLTLTWNFEGTVPEGGWNLVYTVDGSAPITVNCEKNTYTLEHLIPGASYNFRFDIPAETTVYGGTAEFTAPPATAFEGYQIILDYLQLRLCRTPDKEDWTWKDVKDEDYTSDFLVGQRASCVLRLTEEYVTSSDVIDILFVIRDSNGSVVTTDVTSQTWTSLWYKGYCELDLPALPAVPGTYSLSIYFNGAYITADPVAFTVT